MRKFLVFTAFCLLFSQSFIYADTREEQIQEILRAREKMFQSFFDDDDDFKSMHKQMQAMMNQFGQFDQSSFDEWVEDEHSRTLILKLKQSKDKPLDIKIEKGFIKIKGDIEEKNEGKGVRKVHFERMFNLPEDVDGPNPIFENKDGEVRIKFKKKVAQSSNILQNKVKLNNTRKKEERMPLQIDRNETAI